MNTPTNPDTPSNAEHESFDAEYSSALSKLNLTEISLDSPDDINLKGDPETLKKVFPGICKRLGHVSLNPDRDWESANSDVIRPGGVFGISVSKPVSREEGDERLEMLVSNKNARGVEQYTQKVQQAVKETIVETAQNLDQENAS